MLYAFEWKKEKQRLKEAARSVSPWLPKTWSQMSVEEQCSYLNDVLCSVANLVDEYDFHVTMRCEYTQRLIKPTFRAEAFVQATSNIPQDEEIRTLLCHAVCRNASLTLDDVPEPLRKWGIELLGEDRALEYFKCFELRDYGSTLSEALERLFYRIILMLKGYELLYVDGDYPHYCYSVWKNGAWTDDETWGNDDTDDEI